MDNSLSTASSFYGEPPLSPTPAFDGEAHAPQHVPEFAPPRQLSPVADVPRVEIPSAARPEPVADETEAQAPSLERLLLSHVPNRRGRFPLFRQRLFERAFLHADRTEDKLLHELGKRLPGGVDQQLLRDEVSP